MMERLQFLSDLKKQLFEKGDFTCIGTAFSKNDAMHTGDKLYKGHKFIKQFIKQLRIALPDIELVSIAIIPETKHQIVWQPCFRGAHKSALQGLPASNKKVTWSELLVSKKENNLITEEWLQFDLAFKLMLELKRLNK